MALPAALACRALREARRLELCYGGRARVVEVHVVGRSGRGREIMRVWQVRGGSASGATSGWKLLPLDEAGSGRLIDERSRVPRPGYQRDDPAMTGGLACRI